MKKLLSVILLTCLLIGMLFSADNREFRATWSITWHQFSSSQSAEQLKARTIAILDKHVEAGMNAIIWQVRQGGTVYYPSAIEPWGSYLGYKDPGYDPLEFAIQEAHKRGLELHAWFNTFHCSSMQDGAPAKEHPEWVCTDGDGNPMGSSRSLSPGIKAVRDYTVNLAAEIVANYDVDGIHFDYVRWNEYDNTEAGMMFAKQAEELGLQDGEYTEEMESYFVQRDTKEQNTSNRAPAAFSASNRYLFDTEHPESAGVPDSTDLFPDATPGVKFASWGDWRRGSTDVFMKAVHDTVRQIKPWVKISPAALGRYKTASWNGYYSVFQDAAKWFNEGWIDLLTPMSYHWLNASGMYNQLISDWKPSLGPGIAEGRPYSVGPASYLISNWSTHKSIVEKCRTLDWVMGFQFFSYGNWKDSDYPNQSGHTVFAKKTKQPSYHFINSDVPSTPSLEVLAINDSSYTLTITPGAGTSEGQWFVIYQSKDSNIDVDNDEIIDIVFSDSIFTYNLKYDGYQLNNDKYYIAVTQASRYWVESSVSDISSTNVLPSVLPQVVANYPEDASTGIPNNQVVRIEFNKNMDAASVEANLSISPEPENKQISWDNPTWVKEDHLVLNISASWAFETTYTVKLDGAMLDQAGLNLDGNRDGTAGDAYSFSFTVSGADKEAPIIVNINPEDATLSVDTDLPVSIVFNELIDRSTLEGRFLFSYQGLSIEPAYTAFNGSDDRTYVNVKPSSYYPSSEYVTLDILAGIADTAGNAMDAQAISFKTDSSYYANRRVVDNFTTDKDWRRPTFSGSTVGLSETLSSTSLQSTNYVPGFASDTRALKIVLGPTQPDWFGRIHSPNLNSNSMIDTAMNLQAYIYGDGSGYKFRFALRERNGDNLFEVSSWYTVDWTGWNLIEWDMTDTSQLGEWDGMTNKTIDGESYGLESLQFIPGDENPEAIVTCYVDQIRTVDRREGSYPKNHPPTIAAISDTVVAPSTGVYYFAEYSDPDPRDVLTLSIIPDTSAISVRRYSSPAEKFRLKADSDFIGTSNILVIVKDNGVGELADTASFSFTVAINPSVTEVPESFTLHSNYPNPFNPVTTLHFDLPKAENVRIDIFNTQGRRVAVLVDQFMEAGSWEVNFDASYLSSGIYLYKVTAGSEVAIDKMTLLK